MLKFSRFFSFKQAQKRQKHIETCPNTNKTFQHIKTAIKQTTYRTTTKEHQKLSTTRLQHNCRSVTIWTDFTGERLHLNVPVKVEHVFRFDPTN
jgi:hypothetical protein